MRDRHLHIWMLLLCGAVACAYPARAQESPDETADREPITITPDFDGQRPVDRFDEIALTVNRRLAPDEGRIAVILGDTDLSALIEWEGNVIRYAPELLPLPAGQAQVTVYHVRAGQPWEELGRFPIQVRLRGGFDEARLDPSLTLNNKGQLAEDTFPAPEPEPDRRIFQDFSGQLDAQGKFAHSGWSVSTQAQIVGVSYQNEALRFGDLQDDAPKIDLASYNVQVQHGAVGIQLGHVTQGRHRHLITGFGSRGVHAGLAHRRFDVSVAALNGSRVVGWRNISGLNEPDHRILSGTFGVDILREGPGRLRLEGSYLAGSVLPRTGFNQEGVPDAEKNNGGGVRFVAATGDQRFRVEAGYAGSRYTNPFDPTLAQGGSLVPVQEETRYAHYVEATAGIIQNAMLAPHLSVGVDAAYRRERVDPLYRTVAAFVQADNLLNTFEVRGRVGAAAVQLSHSRSEDNLEEISSILKTKTRRHDVSFGVPLAALLAPTTSHRFVLLPTLSYSYNQTRQQGVDLPVNGGFSPTHLPDQMNHIHNTGVAWQGNRWRFDYRFNSAFQDNRQADREEADFLNQAHSFSISLDPASQISLGVDLSLDRAENRAAERVEYTRRLGLRSTVRPTRQLTFSGSVAPTLTRNAEETARSNNTNIRFEGAYSFQFGSRLQWPARGQLFIRYARQTSTRHDILFDINNEFSTWSVNSGINVTLF